MSHFLYVICDGLYICGKTTLCVFVDISKYFVRLLFPPNKELKNDVVLITGAPGGLGLKMCLEFAKCGATVVGWGQDDAALKEAATVMQKEGHRLHTYTCDLRDRESIFKTAQRVIDDIGRVTILVNNAGIVSGQNMIDLKPEELEDSFKVNVICHFYLIQAFLPYMTGERIAKITGPSGNQPRGHIVSISSVASVIPLPGLSDYCATKAACSLMCESLEEELTCQNLHNDIHVTCIYPYFLNTTMFDGCKSTRPWFFPTIDATYCARRIVQAVRNNERDVYIYGRYGFFKYMKCLVPHDTRKVMQRMSGTDNILAQLKAGRAATQKVKSS